MLDTQKIEQIAKSVAMANLASNSVSAVQTKPYIDSAGHDALRITIILTPGSTDAIKGDVALNTLLQIQERLQRAGEDRFPLVEYATTAELEESGGP